MLSFNLPITHSSDKCLLCAYYAADTVLNSGDMTANRTNPCHYWSLLFLGGGEVEDRGQAIKKTGIYHVRQ